MSLDNLVPTIVMAALGLTALLAVIIVILLCIKYVYPRMPLIIQKVIMKIKSKLMWSTALRYSTQSYLASAVLAWVSLAKY